MSSLGKKPILLPKGVEVTVTGKLVAVKGPKGSQSITLPLEISASIKDDSIICSAQNPLLAKHKALWGLNSVLIRNMIEGVTTGYKKTVEIQGVGYKAEIKGKDLVVSVGFSSPVIFQSLPGVTCTLDGTTKIVIQGINKADVGQVAADLRAIRPPEPYKGKGIRYIDEHVRKKVGKAAGK